MAVTKAQVLDTTIHIFHIGNCTRTVGPRGGVKATIVECRRNGQVKTWKTRPDDFSLPVKRGLYDHGYITHFDNARFHTSTDCPILVAARPGREQSMNLQNGLGIHGIVEYPKARIVGTE